MSTSEIKVFFYGLFMDESLLKSKGVCPKKSAIGYVDGYGLRVGRRATLVPEANRRAYGLLMDITSEEAAKLYSEPTVADYVAESVVVYSLENIPVSAICYTLPPLKLSGANSDYAEALLALATSLGFPESYLGCIREAAAA